MQISSRYPLPFFLTLSSRYGSNSANLKTKGYLKTYLPGPITLLFVFCSEYPCPQQKKVYAKVVIESVTL